jgi:hypothetical protein
MKLNSTLLSIVILLSCFLSSPVFAANNQYALLIGIDNYQPPAGEKPAATAIRSGWTNLDGCVNDAKSIGEMVVTRYGFKTSNLATLFNEQASRANIIKQMEELATKAQKGDIVFIYYAGHGSQVMNSLSKETDKRDETMVPADSYKGAHDIRDKELAALYNKILDKGATLTVIFDSCHSGSSSRGDITKAPKFRFIDYSNYDVKDPSEPARPEDRGALIIAAAQDFEYAKEQRDENDIPHGAFTLALVKAMRDLPVTIPAKDLFASTRSILKFYGNSQEPVISGKQERQNQNIFGINASNLSGKTLVAVTKSSGSTIELQGGYVSGLYPGTKLKPVKENATTQIEIVEMIDANKSKAKITTGNSTDIKPGDLMEVEEWMYPAHAALRVYIPKEGVAANTLHQYAQAYKIALAGSKITIVQDPTKSEVKHSHFYDTGKWVISDANTTNTKISLKPDAAEIRKHLPATGTFFVNFPPTPELVQQFNSAFNSKSNVEIVSDPNDAQYVLAGRLNKNGQVEYGFVKSQLNKADSTNAMPLRTDFISAGNNFAEINNVSQQLSDYASKLAKIRAWLMLESPGGGSDRFPFTLEFERAGNERFKTGQVKLNDVLSINLAADEAQLDAWDRKKRFIYVFYIDSKGNMGLLYPYSQTGSVENKLPVVRDNGKPTVRTFLQEVEIAPPTGIDHYFMLATDEPILNLSAFEQEGVLSRGSRGAGGLDDLLNVGATTRGPVRTKSTWALKKVSLKSVE